ncbi:MAG: hypothetical protein HY900_22050 [Deltaproteobacteria bacterium]|nr:hypothetical protein [Deltaproteobacteria bacterium]
MRTMITVTTSDKNLVYAIWDLQSEGVEIRESFAKAEGQIITEVVAYISLASAVLSFLGGLFQLMKSPKDKSPSAPTIRIHLPENSSNVIQFIEANKGEINIQIHQEH